MVKDEPVKDLLGNINKALIQRLLEHEYGGDKSAVPTIDYLAVQSKAVPKLLPGVTRTEALPLSVTVVELLDPTVNTYQHLRPLASCSIQKRN